MNWDNDDPAVRWAKTERAVIGVTDEGTGQAVWKFYRIYLPVGVAVLLAAGFVVGLWIYGNDPDERVAQLGVGLSFAAMGALVGSMVYSAKRVTPLVRPKHAGGLIWLEKPERKALMDQIEGKKPTIPGQVPVLRGAAALVRKGLAPTLLMFPGFMLLYVSQLLTTFRDGWTWFQWLWCALIPFMAALFVVTLRQFRRAGDFLARTGTAQEDSL